MMSRETWKAIAIALTLLLVMQTVLGFRERRAAGEVERATVHASEAEQGTAEFEEALKPRPSVRVELEENASVEEGSVPAAALEPRGASVGDGTQAGEDRTDVRRGRTER